VVPARRAAGCGRDEDGTVTLAIVGRTVLRGQAVSGINQTPPGGQEPRHLVTDNDHLDEVFHA